MAPRTVEVPRASSEWMSGDPDLNPMMKCTPSSGLDIYDVGVCVLRVD